MNLYKNSRRLWWDRICKIMCIYSNNKCMCVFLISPVPIAEPLTSELIDTPVFYNLAPRPIKYRVSVPIPTNDGYKNKSSSTAIIHYLFLHVCVCVCVPACSTWGAGKVLEHLDRSVDDAVLAGWLCLRYYNRFKNRYSEQPLSDVLQEENWNLITALMQASLDMQQSFYRLTMTLKTTITQNTLLI